MKNVNAENGFYKLLVVQPDKFYPTVLKAQSFEVYLSEQLKNNGFDHVIFVQNKKGVFSVEGETEALKEAGVSAKSQSKEAMRGLGIPMKKKPVETKDAPAENARKKISFSRDTEFYSLFVRLLRNTLTNQEKKIAIVIPKIFFTSFMGQDDERIKTKFYRELAEISRSRCRTGSIFITFLEKEQNDLFMFHDMQYREAFPEFQKITQEDIQSGKMMEKLKEVLGRNLQICGYPSPKEVENMLVRNQLAGNIDLKYRLLNDMSSLLSEFTRSAETRERYHWIRFDDNMPLYSLEKALCDPDTWKRTQDRVADSKANGLAWEALKHTRGMEGLVEAIEKLEAEHKSLKGSADRKKKIVPETDRFEEDMEDVVPLLMNMCIVGPPGTGKTMAARMLADVLYEKKLLPTRIFKETSIGQIIGSHIGESERNMRELFKEAVGGVLFFDEAYQLDYRNEAKSGHSFKKDVADLLLKLLYDYRGRICVVFAGYEEPVLNMLNGIEGFASRFKYIVKLRPYTYRQLAEIGASKFMEEEIALDEEVKALWPDFVHNWMSARRRDTEREYANFRTFEEEFFNILAECKDEERMIRSANIPESLRSYFHPYVSMTKEQVDGMFDRFYGMEQVKKEAKELIEREENGRKNPVLYKKKQLNNMVFLGPPGTGKTDVGGTFAQVAGMVGALEVGHLVEVSASEFIKGTVGEGSVAMEKIFMKALDGVLMIDELGSLLEMPMDERKTFLQLVNQYQDRMIVILTGYAEEYERLCDGKRGGDSGYIRRFQSVHHFRMYTASEMTEIFKTVMNRGEQVEFALEDETAKQAVWRYFWAAIRKKGESFGNGQEAINLKEKMKDVISGACVVRAGDQIEITADYVKEAVEKLTGMEFEEYCDSAPAGEAFGESSVNGDVPSVQAVTREMVSKAAVRDGLSDVENDPEFIKTAANSVLYLEMETDRGQAFGTGFLIHKDGYAVTCNHCVEGIRSMRARLRIKGRIGGQDSWHKVTVLNTNPDADLALIKLEGSDFPAAALRGAEEEIMPMEKTTLIGYPFGAKTKDGITCFAGKIASVDPQYNKGGELLLYNGEAKSGNSGSPVFGNDGRVLGVLLGSITEQSSSALTEEINYIRPVKYIWRSFVK